MRERTFLLDPQKTKDIRKKRGWQSNIARNLNVSRHRLNLWLAGINGISESYLSKLCLETNKKPYEILSEESQKFLSNLLILA
jgi:transcriptional regulator with XRE-family HTH domain